MNSVAHARHIRQSPYKVRVILDQVRGMSAAEARVSLEFSDRRAADPVLKCLNSAVANMKSKYELSQDTGELAGEVTVVKAFADEGPTLKRFRPRARGRATEDPQAHQPHHDRGIGRTRRGRGRVMAFTPIASLGVSPRQNAPDGVLRPISIKYWASPTRLRRCAEVINDGRGTPSNRRSVHNLVRSKR